MGKERFKMKIEIKALLSLSVLVLLCVVSAPAMAADLWESDSDIVSGLGGVGYMSYPDVFNKDGTWYLITGEYAGIFTGFNWSGSAWQSDPAIVSGLVDFGEQHPMPTVFHKDGTWYLIAGQDDGTFKGFKWTDSEWQSDPAIVSGLGTSAGINGWPSPTVFHKDGTWYIITGLRDCTFKGFKWTGSAWQSDPAIVSGLGRLWKYCYGSTVAVFYKDGTWYLIAGEQAGGFWGFNWTGSGWQSDPAIASGLGYVPQNSLFSYPDVFYKDGTWYLISGAGAYYVDQKFYGFRQVLPEEIVWYRGALMPWDAERLGNNNTLITEFGNHTVVEVTLAGEIVWQYGNGTAGPGPAQLNCPVDAERLANGNTLITDSKNHRVIEVTTSKGIAWEMTGLNYPWDAERLPSGNTLITDKHNNRVIEVNPDKQIVWEMTGLNHPEDAERLSTGNTLIADYRNHRVIEVNQSKGIVWQYGTTGVQGSGVNELNYPTDVERLANGNTLIADYSNHRVIEVNPAKQIIGQYGTETAGSGLNQLNHPADAERLSNGNTLIAEAGNNRIIEVVTLPLPAPKIVSFAPSSPVYDLEGAARTFNITIDQTVNVSWLINGFLVQTDDSITEASYTNTSAKLGTWIISAIVSNPNGTAMQEWDWIVTVAGRDLTVSAIDAYHNNTGYPPYFSLSNEVDVTVKNIGTEPIAGFNVSLYADSEFIGKLPVPGLVKGSSATVQFKWKPEGKDCEDGSSPVTYTLKTVADCDNDVNETDETNNELTTSETAYWAGWSADEHINAVAWHGTLRGGLNYTTGDGYYTGLYSPGAYQTTHYNIELPAGASVVLARLNVYYTWSKTETYPVMEVSITNTSGTYVVPLDKSYNDRPCDSPAIGFDYPYGNYVYDLTPYIAGSGSYTVRVKNNGSESKPSNFCIAAPGLVILYEDDTKPEREFWILEGADILEGGRRGGAGYLALEECLCNATFPGDVTEEVKTATLGIVSAWGGEAWGAYNSYYWFNDHYLGDGSILGGYGSLYSRTVDGMSMYVGASGDAQMGANVSEVTAYIESGNNTARFGDDGDSMMPCNAFLVVEYENKPSAPFFVYGFVNVSDGTPVNNPIVTIANLNTSEVFTAETIADSNFYQVVTSSWNVSAGNILHFHVAQFNHTITQEEINAGVLEQNITLGPDTTPPASITNLHSTTHGRTFIIWSWTNPADIDFRHTMVYINGNWKKNTSEHFYNATGLSPGTEYEIGTRTVDILGNINMTWVNHSARTAGMCGNVNGEEGVDMGDVILLANYVGYPGSYTVDDEWAANVNGEEGVDMGDVILLANYVGYPGQYELECKYT